MTPSIEFGQVAHQRHNTHTQGSVRYVCAHCTKEETREGGGEGGKERVGGRNRWIKKVEEREGGSEGGREAGREGGRQGERETDGGRE